MSTYPASTLASTQGYHGVTIRTYGSADVNDDRILDKLDNLDSKTTDILVSLARLEEQAKDMPDLKIRLSALERWRWTAMGAIGASGGALALSLYTTLKAT